MFVRLAVSRTRAPLRGATPNLAGAPLCLCVSVV